MEFLVVAKDGTDADAMDRRLAARPAHFERARKAKADGEFLVVARDGADVDAMNHRPACPF